LTVVIMLAKAYKKLSEAVTIRSGLLEAIA
jgi:hypothetical protein